MRDMATGEIKIRVIEGDQFFKVIAESTKVLSWTRSDMHAIEPTEDSYFVVLNTVVPYDEDILDSVSLEPLDYEGMRFIRQAGVDELLFYWQDEVLWATINPEHSRTRMLAVLAKHRRGMEANYTGVVKYCNTRHFYYFVDVVHRDKEGEGPVAIIID